MILFNKTKKTMLPILVLFIATLNFNYLHSNNFNLDNYKQENNLNNQNSIDQNSILFKEYLAHKNIVGNFSIQLPSSWELANELPTNTIAALSPQDSLFDLFRENILIGSFPVDSKEGLFNYFLFNFNYLKKKLPSINIESNDVIDIGGNEAIKLVYSSIADNQKYITVQVFSVKNGRGYIITCMSIDSEYSQFEATFDQIIDSFQFLNEKKEKVQVEAKIETENKHEIDLR